MTTLHEKMLSAIDAYFSAENREEEIKAEDMLLDVQNEIRKQPAQQQEPLTDEQISSIWDSHVVPVFGKNGINPIVFARAIEAAHGITGETK